jgi:glycosyltransferase involved in cell wall biosynthesis
VVNDGSTDKTGEIAKDNGAKVISHLENLGYGYSLKDGIREASYDTIVITDADLTYPFDQVPELLKEYQKGFDMVVAARTGEHYRESFFKSPLRKLLKFIVEFSAGRKIPDINSGLRVFSKRTIQQFFPHLCNTFSFTTSATLAYLMTGKCIKYIEIPYQKRIGKSKVRLLRDSFLTMQYILQVVNYYNPMKLFILFSSTCISLAVLLFLMGIFLHWHILFLLGFGSSMVALLSLGLGLIADLLKQIMSQNINNPNI